MFSSASTSCKLFLIGLKEETVKPLDFESRNSNPKCYEIQYLWRTRKHTIPSHADQYKDRLLFLVLR